MKIESDPNYSKSNLTHRAVCAARVFPLPSRFRRPFISVSSGCARLGHPSTAVSAAFADGPLEELAVLRGCRSACLTSKFSRRTSDRRGPHNFQQAPHEAARPLSGDSRRVRPTRRTASDSRGHHGRLRQSGAAACPRGGSLVTGGSVAATWLPDGRMWYRTGAGNADFILIDPAKKSRMVCDATRSNCPGVPSVAEADAAGRGGRGGGRGGRGGGGGRGGAANNAVTSPDGTKAAFIRDWNLWVRDVATRSGDASSRKTA